ncbi:MAG TPA: phosphotransferase [Trueperaceae bacterium]|nr:phosphotransferase [Trueperaceae bacterium]
MAETELSAAAALYGVAADDLIALGAFESDVYSFEGPHGPSILKVIAEDHRLHDQVQAEVDWLLALVEEGVRVSAPLKAETGRYVERLPENGRVLVAFRRAPGVATRPTDWTDARLEGWGALLGRLQAQSRSWTPPGARRTTLAVQSYAKDVAEVMPDEPAFTRATLELIDQSAPLLTHGADSGLIHADLHQHNMLLHDEGWTAIDFDDCSYGSYAFDLAMPLFYMLKAQRAVPAVDSAARFLPPFLRGFRRHAPDPLGGAEAVAACLNLRQAELVVALRMKIADDQWTDYLRGVEQDLRTRVTQGEEVLSVRELKRWLE